MSEPRWLTNAMQEHDSAPGYHLDHGFLESEMSATIDSVPAEVGPVVEIDTETPEQLSVTRPAPRSPIG